jgi:hypothetical protein
MGFCASALIIILSYILPGISCPGYFIIGGSHQKNSFCELLFSNPLYSYYPFPRIIGEWIGIIIILILLGLITGWIYDRKQRGTTMN